METVKFNSFKEFYPFYLSEHKKSLTKIFHVMGSLGVITIILYSIINQSWIALYFTPLCGYGFAWVSHFFIEKNQPATFKYPFYSFIGDHKMYFEILQGKHKIF